MLKARTKIERHPERALSGQEAEILKQGLVAIVAFSTRQQPFAIPFSYHFDPEEPQYIYFHGARESRAMQVAAAGTPLCITVTLLDGLVYSRSAMYHSMNYRSVVCFGRGEEVTDSTGKWRIFEQSIRRYFPHRIAGVDYEPPPETHLHATTVVRVRIEDWSGKSRTGGPKGPKDEQPDVRGTAGVLLFDPPR